MTWLDRLFKRKPDRAPHIINLRRDSFAIEHPPSCRTNPFGCAVSRAAMTMAPVGGSTITGRFECWVRFGRLSWGRQLDG